MTIFRAVLNSMKLWGAYQYKIIKPLPLCMSGLIYFLFFSTVILLQGGLSDLCTASSGEVTEVLAVLMGGEIYPFIQLG